MKGRGSMSEGFKGEFVPFAVPDIGEEEVLAAIETIRSGWLTTGPGVAAFESEFTKFLGRPDLHAVAVNSATAGLHLALEAAGIGAGDEVLVPTWTFTATAEVVRYLGATPVLVDVDAKTLCIDFGHAATLVSPRTRAVMPVHFSGRVIAPSEIRRFAERFNLKVIEDAAHVLPGSAEGVMIGTGESHSTVFSFYATKTITTGEGGMVVTGDAQVAKRMRTMRLHGIDRDVFDRYQSKKPSWFYEVVAPGYKYNMTDLAASIGRVQLKRADELRNKRAAIAEQYDDAFHGLPMELPAPAGDGDIHSWHLYVVRLGSGAGNRDEFIRRMSDRGIGCSVHFIPLHLHPYWKDLGSYHESDLPVASEEFGRVVSLPIFSAMSSSQVDSVIAAVWEVVGGD